MSKVKLLATALIVYSTCSAGLGVGEQLRDIIPINGKNDSSIYATYPLIEGQWSVEYNKVRENDSSSSFRDINLFQFDGAKLKLGAEYSIKIEGHTNRWIDEPCKVEPTLYKNKFGTSLWKQKCLVIEPITFLQSNNDATRNALASLAKRGIKNDFNSLRITYTRYGDSGKFMRVRFHLFPSNYGLENPVTGIINTSPWSPPNVASDPAKNRFLSALTSYAEYMASELDKAYDSNEARAPINEFIYPEKVQKVNTDTNDSNSSAPSKEVRLKDLKAIFDKGLISKEIYDAQQNRILSSP